MTFDQWWATLTEKEQREIGLHNAKFVWNGAVDECAKVANSYEPRCDTCPSGVANATRNLKAQTQLFDDWDVTWTKSDT